MVRLPIAAHLLLQIKRSLEHSWHSDRLALWAVCCTTFFGGVFRLGKLLLPTSLDSDPAWNILAPASGSGMAASVALAGVEDSTIQLLGRWQSAAFLQYIRTPQERLAFLNSLGGGGVAAVAQWPLHLGGLTQPPLSPPPPPPPPPRDVQDQSLLM